MYRGKFAKEEPKYKVDPEYLVIWFDLKTININYYDFLNMLNEQAHFPLLLNMYNHIKKTHQSYVTTTNRF